MGKMFRKLKKGFEEIAAYKKGKVQLRSKIIKINTALSQENSQAFVNTLKHLTTDSKITLPEHFEDLDFFTAQKTLKKLGLSFKIRLKK